MYDWGEGRALNLFPGRVAPDRAARNFAVSRVVHAAVVPSPAVYDLIYGCQAGVPGVSPPEQPGVDEGGEDGEAGTVPHGLRRIASIFSCNFAASASAVPSGSGSTVFSRV